jgi:hypothetical protein
MKKYIEEKLVNYVANASADRYGQLGVLDFCQVFGDKWKDVLEYNKENPLMVVATYGGRFGSYRGIGSIHSDILDEEIKSKVLKVWANNKNRIANLNSW